MTAKNGIRLVMLLAAVGYLAFRALGPHAGNSVPPAAKSAAIPTNAREFRLGSLDFKACELPQRNSGATTAAFCAPFSVAENRDAPDSRRIDLNLALIKSEDERADTDLVVFFAGGPGQAAVETYPQIAGALAPLRRHHHILLLDQRGTGKSHPLDCKDSTDDAPRTPSDDDGEANPQKLREEIGKCLADVQKTADPRFYTTTIAARDLEDVRLALGAPPLDLVGVSYGTRMAQQYLMRYPDGVRSVVLDSVAPNELVFGAEFAQNLDDALKKQFATCTATPACTKAFGDPYQSLIKLRDALRAKPQEYDLRDPVTFASRHMHLSARRLAVLVRLFAYTPETAALLPLSIAQGLKGDYTPLAGQSQLLQEDMSMAMNGGMQASVVCAEDADLLQADPKDAGTLLGTTLTDSLHAMCEVWPHGTRPADFHTPIRSDKPVFVLEGEFDPVTPPRYGEAVTKGLSNAKLLIAKGQGHNVIGRGCIPKLVDEFVEKLNPMTLDTACANALGPVPALIDFNGSAP